MTREDLLSGHSISLDAAEALGRLLGDVECDAPNDVGTGAVLLTSLVRAGFVVVPVEVPEAITVEEFSRLHAFSAVDWAARQEQVLAAHEAREPREHWVLWAKNRDTVVTLAEWWRRDGEERVSPGLEYRFGSWWLGPPHRMGPFDEVWWVVDGRRVDIGPSDVRPTEALTSASDMRQTAGHEERRSGSGSGEPANPARPA